MKQLVSTHELAGNYTVVIDTTQNKVYLDVLDYDRPGITMASNMQGSLMMDVAEMFSKYKIKPYPDVYSISDSTVGSSEAYDSLDSVKYRARVIRVEDNKLRCFAPIILKTDEQIPDVFILYRKDMFCKESEAKDEIVAVIDLHSDNISEYIQPKNYAYAYIHGNNRHIKGIDISTGQFVKADVYSDNIPKDESATEDLIYQSYKDKRLIYNNIINLSFVIKDDKIFEHKEDWNITEELADVKDTTAYVYWGRYANVSPIKTPEVPDGYITIEDAWGCEGDNRENIFIYTPENDTNNNRIQFDKTKPQPLIGTDRVLLKHHDKGYEAIVFDGENGADVKYNTRTVDAHGEKAYARKYVDVNRTTYTIDSYVEKLPSMSFEWPVSECTLAIHMKLNDMFVRYVNATSDIYIKWVREYGDEDNTNVIALNTRMDEQIAKFRSLLSPYFIVTYSTGSNIIAVTVRGDNVINFNELSFTKTSRLNLIGIYYNEDITPQETIGYRKQYRYFFTGKDTYAKIVRGSDVDLISEAKRKYVELHDVGNTYAHDHIHECFSDYEFYYVRTGNTYQDVPYYIEGGTIAGNTLSLYTMKRTLLCNIEHVPVADFVDIRTIMDDDVYDMTDDKPIDIKTRIAWCDYSSINKHGENLIPSVARPTGLIDVYSAAVSADGWSYGQILYNSSIRRDNDIYFKSTHFSSRTMEDEYISYLFDSCFSEYPWYVSHRVDFVRMVMKCMCWYDDDTKHAPLLIFDYLEGEDCVASRFRENVKDTEIIKGDDEQILTESQQQLLLEAVGNRMLDISINSMSKFFTDYLDDCDAKILDDITMGVYPVLYDDELFCMLYGVPFKVDINTSEYVYKSIIIPCQRFTLRLQEDTNVYPKSLTRIIRNDKAKQIIIATFVDIPVIMPFSMGVAGSDVYKDATMFGNFERNYLAYIGASIPEPEHDGPKYIDSIEAFDIRYIQSTADLDGDYVYKHNNTSKLTAVCINYIADFDLENDLHDNLVDSDGQPYDDSYPAKIAARAIATGTHIDIAMLGYGVILGNDGSKIYPSKVVFFDKNDEDKKYPLGYFYTTYAADEFVHPQALAKMNESGITQRLISMYTPNTMITIDGVSTAVDAMMIPFDDSYNRYVRDIYNDVLREDKYSFVAVVIETVIPSRISSNEGYIAAARNVLEYSSAYYYFNAVMSSQQGISEYKSNKDTFIQTKSGELNSAITKAISLQCYPSSNQMFTYDIVDNDVVKEPYIRLKTEDPTGRLYKQLVTIYNNDTNEVNHKISTENIFDDGQLLRVPFEGYNSSNLTPSLNYRTQRFKSLVVYDKTYIGEHTVIKNTNRLDSILASRLYVKEGKWINVKVNRSSVDIKFYPSIMYGEKLRRILTDVCKRLDLSFKGPSSPLLKDNDYIMYVDKYMFHLYEYELNVYKVDSTDEFEIYAQKSPKSSLLNYDVKKNYEQEYKNVPKKGIFITYNMSLRS